MPNDPPWDPEYDDQGYGDYRRSPRGTRRGAPRANYREWGASGSQPTPWARIATPADLRGIQREHEENDARLLAREEEVPQAERLWLTEAAEALRLYGFRKVSISPGASRDPERKPIAYLELLNLEPRPLKWWQSKQTTQSSQITIRIFKDEAAVRAAERIESVYPHHHWSTYDCVLVHVYGYPPLAKLPVAEWLAAIASVPQPDSQDE